MAFFYVVSTPIGNLEDISKRALRILSEVDLILCEDTRVVKKLLSHYRINTFVLSYHHHSKIKKIDRIIDLLKKGKNLALVSDAGTPGISDPGNKLIHQVLESTGGDPLQIKIIPIPGPSAVTATASVSGFPMDKFLFLGFPPTKNKRKKFFQKIKDCQEAIIFYESPYRIIKTLEELSSFLEDDSRKIVVCRELTKKFETIYRGKRINEILNKLKREKIRGEFVVVIGEKLKNKQKNGKADDYQLEKNS